MRASAAWLLPAALSLAAGAAADRASLEGWEVELSGCRLVAAGPGGQRAHDFAFPPPCSFSRDRYGRLQAVSAAGGTVLMIQGARAFGGRCDTRLQALILTPDAVALSEDIQTVSACPNGGWDEKMFEILARRQRTLHSAKPSEP